MALDEPRENDEIIKDNGISYLIDKELLDQAKPISVDFVESAFGSGFSPAIKVPSCFLHPYDRWSATFHLISPNTSK